VSYNFPPVGGAGVQRPVKLIKYLPSYGVETSVLTVANASVPLRDETLLLDIPDSVDVTRARTMEPGYGVKQAAWAASAASGASTAARVKRHVSNAAKQLLIPDPQILWQPGAQLALARRLWSAKAPDVVCISAPPFSQFLLAPLARLRPKTAIVFDYRDEWSTYRSSYEMMSKLSVKTGEALERSLLKLADGVVTATEAFRRELLERFEFLDPDRVQAVPNGYDPDDFPPELPSPPSDRFVLTYAGTVFKLTSARGLLAAIRLLHEREPELARLLSVRFIGRIVDTEADAFEGMEAYGVQRLGYIEHDRVLPELAASHLVACILDEVPGTERIYPAKIFELTHLRRPCLTLAGEGALATLVRRHQLGPVIGPRDSARIAEYLSSALGQFRAGTYTAVSQPVDVQRYDRRLLAGEFVHAFEKAAERAKTRAASAR
jgi:glycosyltransferase involved in cell wall biosynthesis